MIARAFALSVFLSAFGTTAAAQIQIVQQTRVVSGVAHAQSEDDTQHTTFNISAPDTAPFYEGGNVVSILTWADARSNASQVSQLASNRITGSGQAGAQAYSGHGLATAYSDSASRMDVTFQVTEPLEYSLTGSLDQSVDSAIPRMELAQGGVPIHTVVIPPLSNGHVAFEFLGVLTPGTYTLSAVALADASALPFYSVSEWSSFQVEFATDPLAGTPFCAGDGTGTACPCGNDSAPAARVGCLNSQGTGGKLRAGGTASLSNDTLVLFGSKMPNSSALYFQGTLRQNGGNGATFGDGKRCAGGTITRLVEKNNVDGASQYPSVGHLPISIQGAITSPGTRTYQVWYRNAADYCTAATYNLTNGVEVLWGP